MADDADRAQEAEMHRQHQAQLRGASARAAQPMATSSSGICCDCGEAIPPARLAVMPRALWCVECAARAERGAWA